MSEFTRLPDDTLIEVCSKCLTAACWHGYFMCDDAREAGTVWKTVKQLDQFGLENPEHYSKEYIERICGGIPKPEINPYE